MSNGIAIEQQLEDLHDAVTASNRYAERLQKEVQDMAILVNELTDKIAALNRLLTRQEAIIADALTPTNGTLY